MELRVLQYFLVVAREENITKAAALLHITQPTLSRQLMQMEKERLENGILDMGLLLEPVEISRYHYARMPLMEQYYALMRSDCPLAALPAVTPQDLVNMPLIVAKRQSVRNQLEHWFGQDAKNLRIACTCNLSHNNLSVMVQSGVGVTVTIKAADIYQDLCFRPLQPQRITKMTMKEVLERYKIPTKILNEYENWGLCGQTQNQKTASQYDDRDITQLGLMMTLYDIGFCSREVERYMRLALDGNGTQPARLAMLKRRRGQTLGEIHCKEKQIAHMDYLRHEMEKEIK